MERHHDGVVLIAGLESDRLCSKLERAAHCQLIARYRGEGDRLRILEQVLSGCCKLRGEKLSLPNPTSIDDVGILSGSA